MGKIIGFLAIYIGLGITPVVALDTKRAIDCQAEFESFAAFLHESRSNGIADISYKLVEEAKQLSRLVATILGAIEVLDQKDFEKDSELYQLTGQKLATLRKVQKANGFNAAKKLSTSRTQECHDDLAGLMKDNN